MGFFSKIFKGIKKVVKKIGKGIKKVVKKVSTAVDKLGIVGQIGMMFLMPYAMKGLGNLFGQFAGGTSGTWANALMSKSNIAAKALGHTMNAIHTVGTTVIKPFTFIRDQIGEAVNWIGDQTNTGALTDGVNKLIGYEPDKLELFDLEAIRSRYRSPADFGLSEAGGAAIDSSLTDRMWESVSTDTMMASTAPSRTIVDTGVPVVDQPSLLSQAGEGIRAAGKEVGVGVMDINTVAPTLDSLTNAKRQGWFASQGESVVNSFRDFSVGEMVSSGIKRGGSERLAYAVAGDPPQQKILQTVREQPNLFALSNMFSDSTIFRSVNLASERQGNVWAGTNALNYDYIKNIGNDGTADYYNNMRGLELMN